MLSTENYCGVRRELRFELFHRLQTSSRKVVKLINPATHSIQPSISSFSCKQTNKAKKRDMIDVSQFTESRKKLAYLNEKKNVVVIRQSQRSCRNAAASSHLDVGAVCALNHANPSNNCQIIISLALRRIRPDSVNSTTSQPIADTTPWRHHKTKNFQPLRTQHSKSLVEIWLTLL